MKNGGERPGAGGPKGSKNKLSPEVRLHQRLERQAFIEAVQQFALHALQGLAQEAPAGSLPHAQELLDRAYGRVPEAPRMSCKTSRSIARPTAYPIKLEDWRRQP
jgi:hypothetical protein